MSIIRDASLWESGKKKIDWVKACMPVLNTIEKRFEEEKPLSGLRLSMSIHLEAKTAYLATVLVKAGAHVAVTGCNPLSTQDDVAAALAHDGYDVYAWHGATEEEYTEHLTETLKFSPHIIIDDGGDLVNLLHGSAAQYGDNIIGGAEETTTGVHRLRARANAGDLKFPMFAVNDANCKHLFDNRHGTGQSTWDAIMNTTNHMIAGKTVVVAGYGFCGKGVSLRARGLGANVVICEVSPFRALEAYADGYRVMSMDEASSIGDIFVTTTGCRDIIRERHFKNMKNGVLLANSGHFDVEINKGELLALAVKTEERKPNIVGYTMADGRVLNLLGEGRLVNLAAGNGHPAEIMDLSFGIQALGAEYIAKNAKGLKPGLYDIPPHIDETVARLKLESSGIYIDSLTDEQSEYLKKW